MTHFEFRWVLGASLLAVLLASVPTLCAWALADTDHVFTGFVYDTGDGNPYMAKMRLGARGEWLFHLLYTTEPHPGSWLYTATLDYVYYSLLEHAPGDGDLAEARYLIPVRREEEDVIYRVALGKSSP